MSSSTQTPSKKSTGVRFNPVKMLGVKLRLQALWNVRGARDRSADLFCTPLPGTRKRALRADMDGSRLEKLELPEGEIATYRWGGDETSPLVVFSHGWSSYGLRASRWAHALLGAGYRVVSFDHLGHGRSSGKRATLPQFARTMVGVCEALGPVDTLIGHSLGGAAVATALAEGVAARRAILIAPAADPLAATARFARALGLPAFLQRDMEEEIGRREGMEMSHWQAHRMAPLIGTPALVIHDLQDAEVAWDEGERYARYWPQARLMSTHGLGHHRIVSDDHVIASGLAFLRGVPIGERVVSTQDLPFGLA